MLRLHPVRTRLREVVATTGHRCWWSIYVLLNANLKLVIELYNNDRTYISIVIHNKHRVGVA